MSVLARPLRTLLSVLLIAVAASACGGSSGAAPAAPPPAMQASALTGPLSVLAAEPLGKAYQDAQVKLANTNPGLALTYRFAGSPALTERLRQGTPTDVFAADEATVRTVADAGLVEAPEVFARTEQSSGQNSGATYSIAVVKTAKNRAGAQAFVDYLVSGRGQRILQSHGFTAP